MKKYNIIKIIYMIKFFFIELFNPNVIIINGFFPRNMKFGNANFGDDLNLHIIKKLSNNKYIIPYSYSVLSRFFKKTKYSCIGSVINYADKKTIVWGSGAIDDALDSKFDPKEILAVRGPMTRELLIRNGFSCPKIYGDPALLTPLYYKPIHPIRYKLGIIPHYIDKNSPLLDTYKDNLDVLIIDVQEYGKWTDFIDKVISCGMILSSSLHGLIIADAYDVPNIWCKFSENIRGNDFKFHDYFLSTGRNTHKPFKFDQIYKLDYICSLGDYWEKPNIDILKLLDSCPFVKK